MEDSSFMKQETKYIWEQPENQKTDQKTKLEMAPTPPPHTPELKGTVNSEAFPQSQHPVPSKAICINLISHLEQ